MKLTRSSLKDLIKECIVEVLSEGNPLGPASSNISEGRKIKRSSRDNTEKPKGKRSSQLDRIKFDKKANAAASSITDDPVMQSMFTDTAKTTLQEQINNKNLVPVGAAADHATRVAAAADPTEMFEGSSNWASLAFPENIKTQ